MWIRGRTGILVNLDVSFDLEVDRATTKGIIGYMLMVINSFKKYLSCVLGIYDSPRKAYDDMDLIFQGLIAEKIGVDLSIDTGRKNFKFF